MTSEFRVFVGPPTASKVVFVVVWLALVLGLAIGVGLFLDLADGQRPIIGERPINSSTVSR